ncbi:unnamed protein product [Cuscuta epithymum]|uniref:Uncharacterized protein n=1 Tax=Cuscuta epithymum TaxID=186058 RepID=A0AAV0D993_9ASTE|nr:unnamed protein product [Cuscuta epithymum]
MNPGGNAHFEVLVEDDEQFKDLFKRYVLEEGKPCVSFRVGYDVSKETYGGIRDHIIMNNIATGRADRIGNPRPIGNDSPPEVITCRRLFQAEDAFEEYGTNWRLRNEGDPPEPDDTPGQSDRERIDAFARQNGILHEGEDLEI